MTNSGAPWTSEGARLSCRVFGGLCLALLLLAGADVAAQGGPVSAQDRKIRDRYEQILERNPFQEQAFDRVFQSYSENEGLAAWEARLRSAAKEEQAETSIVLGRLLARLFKPEEAIEAVERGLEGELEMESAARSLLGRLCHLAGQEEKAAAHLEAAIPGLVDPERRAEACRLLGAIHLRRGARADAVVAWERLIERNPGDLFALLELAAIYEDNRLWDRAVDAHERIAALSEADPYRQCLALRGVGAAQLRLGRHEKAIAAFERAMALAAPGNWLREDLQRRLIEVHRDRGDLDGLLEQVDARLAQSGDDAEWLKLRAETLIALGRGREAEKTLLKILERQPREEATHRSLLELRKTRGDREGVVQGYERLIELFPDDTAPIRQLGNYLLESGDAQAARRAWTRVTAGERGQGAGNHAQLAEWFEEHGMERDAIAAYGRALEMQDDREWALRSAALQFRVGDAGRARESLLGMAKADDDPDAIAELAAVLEANSLREDAIQLYRRILRDSSDRDDIRMRLARALMAARRPEEALRHFANLAEESDNEFVRSRAERGWIDALQALGLLEERMKAWETDLAEAPGKVALISRLLTLYESAGDSASALEMHQRRTALEPGNSVFQAGLAVAYSRRRRPLEAAAILERLTVEDPTRAREHWRRLIGLYERLGEREQAVKAAEAIVSLAPNDPEPHVELAELLVDQGDLSGALREFRAASRLAPDEPRYVESEARILLEAGRNGEAWMAYRRMYEIASTPELRRVALRELTRLSQIEQTYPSLVDEFADRARRTPKRLAAYVELAEIQIAGGDHEEGIATLERARERVTDIEGAMQELLRASIVLNDYQGALTWHRALIERRGNPSDSDYEQLGRIQARLGRLADAERSWNRISKSHPNDSRVTARVATLFEQADLLERAEELRRRSVRLAPEDSRLRYAHARTLAAMGRHDAAAEELLSLLRSAERDGPARPAGGFAAIPLGSRSQVTAHLFNRPLAGYLKPPAPSGAGIRSQPGPFPGKTASVEVVWAGDPESRRSLIYDLAGVYRAKGDQGEFTRKWRELMEASREDKRLKRDWITVCETLADPARAAEAGLEYLSLDPDDQEVGIRTALFLASTDRLGEAMKLLNRHLVTGAELGPVAAAGLVAVLLKDGQKARAARTADWMLENFPDPKLIHTQTLASLLFSGKEYSGARKMYERLVRNGEGRAPQYSEFQLAEISRIEGDREQAVERYTRILLGATAGPAFARRSNSPLYTPVNFARIQSNPHLLGLPPQVLRFSDTYRSRSLHQLDSLVPDFYKTPTALKLESAWEGYRGKNPDDRESAWNSVKLAVAYHLRDDRNMEALALLGRMIEAGRNDVEVVNLKVFAQQKEFLFDEMRRTLEDFGKRHPRRGKEVRTALRGVEGIERAPKRITLNNSKAKTPLYSPLAYVTSTTNKLEAIKRVRSSQKSLATSMLDRHLETGGRDSESLHLAAQFAHEDGRKGDAIRHIVEAWMKRSKDEAPKRVLQAVSSRKSRIRVSIPVEQLLLTMHQIYLDAGKLKELIQVVERTALTNSSARAWADVVQIHAINGDFERAANAFRRLARDYPDAEPTRSGLVRLMPGGTRR